MNDRCLQQKISCASNLWLAAMVCVLACGSAIAKQSGNGEDSFSQRTKSGRKVAELTDQRIEKLFKIYWGPVAKKYVLLGDDYVACPTFNVRYPNSRLKTTNDVIRENTESFEVTYGANITKTRYIKPSKADAEAHARVLPKLAIGEYGYIASCIVNEITDDGDMIVKDVWLIDVKALKDQMSKELKTLQRQADKRAATTELKRRYTIRMKLSDYQKKAKGLREPMVLRGFASSGVVEGERWVGGRKDNGIAVAVVKIDSVKKGKKTNKQFVLAPVKIFNRGGLSLSEFEKLMNKCEVDKRWFVYRVLESQRDDEHDWIRPVVEALEGKNRQARAKEEMPPAEH